MTEEEKKAIVRAREHINDEAGNYLSIEEIKTLLNLIDKQKEDIMYLRMDVQDLADDVEFWQDRCDNSIDKDDIRHKIKNINENIENLNNSCEFESAYVQAELEELRTKKHSLEELLEEN